MSPKRRTVVKHFKEQFAPKVKSGEKTQTIRPVPKHKKHIPRVGDLFSGRQWEGKPYRSKQIRLREGEVTEVMRCKILENRIQTLEGENVLWKVEDEEKMAKADGFKDWAEMREWFRAQYGLPWEGILIRWKPDPA